MIESFIFHMYPFSPFSTSYLVADSIDQSVVEVTDVARVVLHLEGSHPAGLTQTHSERCWHRATPQPPITEPQGREKGVGAKIIWSKQSS